ncbi:uncharacterized protein LOC124378202 [Tachysurus ichikawai]
MGDLPHERAGPAAPFEFTTLDLFGPYEEKDEVRKRVRLKVWGIVYCCMASRAIHTDVVSDQSAESFLLAYQRFTALRGHPRKLWSDPGSNFVGAKPALTELYKFLDKVQKSELEGEAAKHGIEWYWKIHPASSPHRNGAAEAFATWEVKVFSHGGPRGDPGDFDFVGYPYKRLKIIQGEVNKFWKEWSQLAGPNLFVRSKWHTKERNVAVGDVVWLADQNAIRSQYKLARVVKVNADHKGVVRDVDVRVFTSYPISSVKPGQVKISGEKTAKQMLSKISATILHRDVRRLVILIPVEEQSGEQREE